MTITEFLLARIAEDEAVARAVIDGDNSEGRWRWDSHRLRPYRSALVNDRENVVLPAKHEDVYPSSSVAHHIACHDPARVLTECQAKRAIVEFAAKVEDMVSAIYQEFSTYPDGDGDDLLKILAAVYADHPDYNPAWRP